MVGIILLHLSSTGYVEIKIGRELGGSWQKERGAFNDARNRKGPSIDQR